MSLSFLAKLAPYLAAIGLLIGVFFYGVNVGKGKQKIVYQERIIEVGKRHIEIEKKQAKIISSRANIDVVTILRKGEF